VLPELGEISKRRRSLGLTQSQLAHLVNVSQSMIAKIEAQSINPSYTSAKRIFDVMEQMERGTDTKAGEIATKKVVSVGPQDNLKKAATLMREAGFSQLPVIEQGRPIGSVSEKLVLSLIMAGKSMQDISTTPVLEVMEEAFPTVDEESDLTMASALLQYSPAVLLTRKGKLTGIVTKADLLKVVRTRNPTELREFAAT